MINQDLRVQTLHDWLVADLALDIQDLAPASSDASFRRYFRIMTPEQTLIVMDAPPEKENLQAFIKTAGIMREAGVNVPEIYAVDLPRGFMLLEDFGTACFLQQLTDENADRLYQDALDSLLNLQTRLPAAKLDLPRYDAAFFERELAIFYDWFLTAFLKVELPAELKNTLNEILIHSALQQPQTIVHRDFHSRNLMHLETGNPGVIDFQDAVIGPISYDLVSLLKDCYIDWPSWRVDKWRDDYLQRLRQQGLVECDSALFKRWFDLMGMQRHLKAIGIFARLHLRDGKPGYLKDIPRTMAYVAGVSEVYPELRDFQRFIQRQIEPAFNCKLS